jgi:hypothetical protein
MSWIALVIGLAAVTLTACSRSPGPGETGGVTAPPRTQAPTGTQEGDATPAPIGSVGSVPDGAAPCREVFNAVRCQTMIDFAAVELGVTRADIASVEVLTIPEPTPEIRDGVVILRTSSEGPPVIVRVTLDDASSSVLTLECGRAGASWNPPCSDDPHLGSARGLPEGWTDLPCAGEPPDGCASPVPTAAPEAIAAAVALRLGRVDIPIDHVGDHEVLLGEARLPNGRLSAIEFEPVDPWPSDVTILSGGLWIQLRSLEPDGRPFHGIYEHGWREGTERVAAYLIFHVDGFEPGAVLSIRDVVVR